MVHVRKRGKRTSFEPRFHLELRVHWKIAATSTQISQRRRNEMRQFACLRLTTHPTSIIEVYPWFINIASGSKLYAGESLHSCTDKIETLPPFVLNDRHVTLIDTPSFDNTAKSDTEVLELKNTFLSKTYKIGQHLGAQRHHLHASYHGQSNGWNRH
ncbi:hypothetical protein PM082_002184 [Marasmius tenuissimus]|nr:hypothetical protein PM082_002184 [Marasmius tenuissimus]